MTLQLYDGNIHPDEWLKQINTYCFLKNITDNNVKLAKMMVDSTIHVPKDVTSLKDIFKRFNNILIEPIVNTNIKNGSIVALKHVATGKYLSTIENLRYETGSKSQMVYTYIYLYQYVLTFGINFLF